MTKARQQRLWAALAILEAVLALGFLAATLHAQQTDRAKEIGGKLLCGVGTPQVRLQTNSHAVQSRGLPEFRGYAEDA